MSNPFISFTYGVRNVDKTSNGDIGRLAVFPGQFINGVNSAKEYGGVFETCANAITKTVDNLGSSNNAIWKGTKKVLNFSAEHTNSLLCAAAGIRVLTAEDKEHQAAKEVCGMSTMFLGEEIMKTVRKKIGLLDYAKKVDTSTTWGKCLKFGAIALDAALQVGASIVSYDVGAKIGTNLVPKKTTESEASENTYQTMADLTQYNSQASQLEGSIFDS